MSKKYRHYDKTSKDNKDIIDTPSQQAPAPENDSDASPVENTEPADSIDLTDTEAHTEPTEASSSTTANTQPDDNDDVATAEEETAQFFTLTNWDLKFEI